VYKCEYKDGSRKKPTPERDEGPRPRAAAPPQDTVAQRFLRTAEVLLDAETYAMLLELAQDTGEDT